VATIVSARRDRVAEKPASLAEQGVDKNLAKEARKAVAQCLFSPSAGPLRVRMGGLAGELKRGCPPSRPHLLGCIEATPARPAH
jgi:hypothetical protein